MAQPDRNVVYLHYYLWWTPTHWQDKLGPLYPYDARPLPVPGTMDASGCSPQPAYAGATIVDVPAAGLYDQRDAAAVDRQIATAAAAGVTGFLLDWQGTGLPNQSLWSSGANARLDLIVDRVDAYDSVPGRTKFGLGLAFAVYGEYNRPKARMLRDLEYFTTRYGSHPAFENPYSPHPIVMLMASRRYSSDVLPALAPLRSKLYLVGDETSASWPVDEGYLDAASYYWSSENPWSNPTSGPEIAKLGDAVHAAGKRWFAPFTPGYDKELAGGRCVPRNGTQTMRKLWELNGASQPDAWFGISWNEYVENTYLEPSQAYGATYLDELADLIATRS
ncbi:MAG: hypothetical protein ABI838_03640, partial [Chloroflexota bacterium]